MVAGRAEALQSGLVLLGEAITMPELAPAAFLPVDPTLSRIPCSAMGTSAVKKDSAERLKGAEDTNGQWQMKAPAAKST